MYVEPLITATTTYPNDHGLKMKTTKTVNMHAAAMDEKENKW